MATILCIETTTTNCSVALSVDGIVVSLKEENDKNYSHAEKLHLFIEDVLVKSKITKDNLDAIAVSKGPGSYTGLRIGVSAAKGLCFALEIPLISIPTLEALAYQVKNTDGTIVPMLDARRLEVYSAVFSKDKIQIRDTRAEVLDDHSFANYLNENTSFILLVMALKNLNQFVSITMRFLWVKIYHRPMKWEFWPKINIKITNLKMSLILNPII